MVKDQSKQLQDSKNANKRARFVRSRQFGIFLAFIAFILFFGFFTKIEFVKADSIYSVYFNGVNTSTNNISSFPEDPVINLTAWTACWWANLDGTGTGDRAMWEQGTYPGTGETLSFIRNGEWKIVNWGRGGEEWGTGYSPTTDVWHFYCYEQKSNGTIDVYVDGSKYGNTHNISPSMTFKDHVFKIGNTQGGGDVAFMPYKGAIDEIGIWSDNLTAGEISDLWNSGTGKELNYNSDEDLRWLLHLNEGTGKTANDEIGVIDGTLTAGTSWIAGKVPLNAVCDIDNCSACLNYEDCASACGSDKWFNGACLGSRIYLNDPYFSIDNPTEAQEFNTNQITISGDCKYPEIEMVDYKDDVFQGGIFTNCVYPFPSFDPRYQLEQEVIVDGYSTSTGRLAGYARVLPPIDFEELTKTDRSDFRFYRYEGDQGVLEAEIVDWYYDGNYLYFPIKEEALTGYENPKYRYFYIYGWYLEDRPTTLKTGVPPAYDFNGVDRYNKPFAIIGSYSVNYNVSNGSYVIAGRTAIENPAYLTSHYSDDRNFSVAITTPIPPAWQDFDLFSLYGQISPYKTPSSWLNSILTSLNGVFSPVIGFINNINAYFSINNAVNFAETLIAQFKIFISFTKMFDNLIGGIPITAGLIFLIFVYVAVIVIKRISHLGNLIKP